MMFPHHHNIEFPPGLTQFCIMLPNHPAMIELVDPELMTLPDPHTIADNQLVSHIVLLSPHHINDFSQKTILPVPPITAEYRSKTALLAPHQINPYVDQTDTVLLNPPTTEYPPTALLLAHIICADCGEPAPYCHGPVGHPPPPPKPAMFPRVITSPLLLSPRICPDAFCRLEKRSPRVLFTYAHHISIVLPGLF